MSRTRSLVSFLMFVAVLALTPIVWAAEAGTASTPSAAASQPASQPASEIVLVRLGPSVITQADFNLEATNLPLENVQQMKAGLLRQMIVIRRWLVYLQDHPEMVDQAYLDAEIDKVIKKEGVKTREELETKLKGKPGGTQKFKDFLNWQTLMAAKSTLTSRGRKLANDETVLKQRFDQEPSAFNGTRRKVRHILFAIKPWETPEQVKARQDKLAQMRADIIAGRRTWEQCSEETDDLLTKAIAGDLGTIPRHWPTSDAVGRMAFKTPVGEISDVFQEGAGFHILQVREEQKGDLTFSQAKYDLQQYLISEPYWLAEADARAKYPAVGVREPDLPPPPPPGAAKSPPKMQPMFPRTGTRPSGPRQTRPGGPAPLRPTSRPAAAPRR
jgi:hypothetical protein